MQWNAGRGVCGLFGVSGESGESELIFTRKMQEEDAEEDN